ncbi:MAG: indolepyruvate oxidoreductase subunit beta [Treponema sp.]|nr:indolepyruvate oxidoreductase subunit beta [Treponema sp.]MCL2252102.1 indolepyruvate oxidoreductase subunit beta [Treponema sp.]
MKYDVILAGVGGQGVLSVASIIARAAVSEGLEVRQSEVHGMAQRGGAVLAHMRIADGVIPGDLVPKGGADLIISMEPLESLRYVSYLKPDGMLVTASEPFNNISNYPELEGIYSLIKSLPKSKIVETSALAKTAGLSKAVNTVMVGAASCFLPIKAQSLEKTITETFSKKDVSVAEANVKAFNLGQAAVKAG